MVIVAMLVSSAVLGCSTGSRAASTETIEVSMDDVLKQSAITRDATLAVGDTLKVTLGSNHSTPYRWTADPKIGDSAILKQTSHVYAHSNTDRMGAPGSEVWTFTALKGGTTTIVAGYASVVGSDTSPTCTFTANVTVK
jgi:inhibitor of cysteine peptidase